MFVHAETYLDHDISVDIRRQVGGGYEGRARIWWDHSGVRSERVIAWPEANQPAGDADSARAVLLALARKWCEEHSGEA